MNHLLLLALAACAATPTAVTPESVPAVAPTSATVLLMPASQVASQLNTPLKSVRIVNFWATWCAPCVQELPRIAAWAKVHPEAELILVNLDISTLHNKKVVPFVKRYDLGSFHNWQLDDADPARAVADAIPEFNGAVPLTLIVPANQRTREVIYGQISNAQLDAAISK